MPKRFLEDMVMAKRASREKIKKPELNREVAREPVREPEPEREDRKEFEAEKIREMVETMDVGGGQYVGKSKSRYFLWFIAFISVLFCFFAVSFLFAKAKIVVNPKTQDVVLKENLSADKDSNSGADGLSFNLVVIPGQESKNIPVTGEKNASIKATGTVLIFNAFSSSPQNLDIDTRLEGSNGKIYKTQTKTTVPGISKSGTPGQVEVGIYAAEPGQAYNSSSSISFTIFGFKGTPKYSKFMAISKKGTTISGGFVGQAPDISDADKATALVALKTDIQTDLLNKTTAQIPDGFILFKNATFINTDDANMSSVYNADNTATLTLSGTLYGIILNEQELTKKIATDNVNKYDGSDVFIPNIKDLAFSLTNQDNANFDSLQNINFSLSGPAKIVWKLDVNKFTSDLLGKSKSDFTQILSQYTNVNSATLTLSPIWKMSIPDKTKDVKVIVNYPQ
jgi:hypothetical protein